MILLHLICLLIGGGFQQGNAIVNCEVECSPIKAIIFDFDGTLIDNGSAHFIEWQYALAQQGFALQAEEFWEFMNKNKLIGSPTANEPIARHYCALLGRDCAATLLKDQLYYALRLQEMCEFTPIEPTVRFLRRLGEEKVRLGIQIGLASANNKRNILRVLTKLGVIQYFDVVVAADDVSHIQDLEGTNKPKPYVYLHASELLGLHPSECVAIEDSRTGISSAVTAGCFAIAIPNVYTASQDLSLAHWHMNSLEDVSPTHFLCMVGKAAKLHNSQAWR